MDSSCCADHSRLVFFPSDTYSGRYEHLSLALRREIDRELMGKWDSCKRYWLALFDHLKCIPSMQIWYQWIALVVLIVPNLFLCPYDIYSRRYEHVSLALRREIDRKLMGKWDSCKRYWLALFNCLKCILSMQIGYRWIALVVLIIPSLFLCPSDTCSGRYEHFSLA
jgi:uncharacterized membrane protein YhaH (DUF805 family)